MVTDIIKSVLEVLKLAPRYLIAVVIICALLLFTPEDLQRSLGITEVVETHRPWIGLALISSLAIWLVAVFVSVGGWVKALWRRREKQKKIIARLNNMTEAEKQILRYYFAKDTRSNILRIESGDVQALVHSGIIYRSTNRGSIVEGFAHNITDFSWDYICENPQVLVGETNTYHTDKRYNW